jgi:hypothetical protein
MRSARAMNCLVVPLLPAFLAAQARRIRKKSRSPTWLRSTCKVMAPRT